MSNTAPAAAAADTPKPKSRKGLMIVAVVALVVLLGGGAAAYFMLGGKDAEGAEAAEAAEPEETGPGAAIALEPFIVNLADPGGSRFLRVSLSLVVPDEAHAAEIEESALVKARVRSSILELLAQQTADSLVTPDGKTALKTAIAEKAAEALEGLHITDVLFSEFVVQF